MEADRAVQAASSWTHGYTYAVKREQEERDRQVAAAAAAAIAKMAARLHAKRAEKAAAIQPGRGGRWSTGRWAPPRARGAQRGKSWISRFMGSTSWQTGPFAGGIWAGCGPSGCV